MIRPTLDKILVDPAVAATPIARAVSRNAGGVEVIEAPAGGVEEALRRLGLTEGKRVLLVKEFRGRSFKQCQGLKEEYACCNLHTLAEGNGCAMECTYCILQHYMTSQHLTVFANVDDLQAEIQRAVSSEPERIFRVGTGELSDSLLLDPLTESTRHMVPFFRSLPNAVLELRTKTDNVENLLDLEHGGKTVVAWSLNPPEVGEREELKTAPLEARLRAASEVARRGYPVGFHLDPMVHYEGWQDGYSRLVAAAFEAVPPEQVAWVSLGTLRFPPEMKGTIAARFPRSELRHGELIRGADGKLHYVRPLRIEMYRSVVQAIESCAPERDAGPVVYLCMEPPDVWKRVFGQEPSPNDEIEMRLAGSYHRRFVPDTSPRPRLEAYRRVRSPSGEGVPALRLKS
ncbi:MAG TPA: hypothetical protein VFD71_19920 [Planctomycetota bacterium]|jgi:spore photoproduct lyase|nr:hypothetical protein [Planctomycetota bacterium]